MYYGGIPSVILKDSDSTLPPNGGIYISHDGTDIFGGFTYEVKNNLSLFPISCTEANINISSHHYSILLKLL